MDTAPTATTPASYTPAPSARLTFLAAFRREHATTMKVLRAFPGEQSELRPHTRSNSARQLAWTFVIEERLMIRALAGTPMLGDGAFPASPDSWDEVLATLEESAAEVVRLLEAADDAVMGGTVQFFVAPKQVGDIPTVDFLWFMLHDQIHHRGQLSVYLRIAGAKVPSIYGPSADEPWN
jgi:uncharacterized damage-inducible protein DinB